ncbi:MAG TPA: fatty acid desaturase [Ktedonobacteraceae bacterium]|nr:fatty acid desaturase [Ktedonobacteraceae bacterium]
MALAQRPLVNDYAELKRRVRQKGLLEQQPAYYTYKILFTYGLLALSIACLVVFRHSWFQLLNAVFLAFVSGQIGFIGHDVGHRQIFRSRRLFELASFVTGNLMLGWSWSWWVDKHNRHHGHPNEADIDPDISIPLLAFTEEAARGKRGFLRFMVKHQAYLYLPLELLGWTTFLIFSISFLLQKRAKYPRAEGLFMTIHYLLYFGLLFSCLTVWQALLFFVIHRALFGLYLGSVAAPNHKGMLVSDKDTPLDFLHQQILSSRNVRAHPVTDFWYGGLNYQIEHHLMPTIPRNKLREAQQVVKAFCEEHGIPYHETGFRQSYREIFQHLYQVSTPLRKGQV